MKSKTANMEAPEYRILKIASCPSLSGKSNLVYHVGCQGEGDIHFRIYDNSGGGFYSNEWIAMTEIQHKLSHESLVRCSTLHPIFKGKSANTAGFVLAVLKHEGLVERSKDNPRCYVHTGSDAFALEVKGLIESSVDLHSSDADSRTVTPKTASAPTKPAAALPTKVAAKARKQKA